MVGSDDLVDVLSGYSRGPNSDPAHDLGHVERVWKNVRVIARGEGVAVGPVLTAATWLHDVVQIPKDHPDRARASTLSGRKAWQIVRDLGFTREDADAVSHAVSAHSFSGGIEPRTDEARILRDADRLDAIGAVGLARCFAVSGALGRSLWDDSDPFAQDRLLDDRKFALDHFGAKLMRIEGEMCTATGARLAVKRSAVLQRFLDDLARELDEDSIQHRVA